MSNPESSDRKKTPLNEWHANNGGRMVDFAGWDLPVFYPMGAVEEHHATRRSVGLFDIDHMGQVEVSGPTAIAAVDRLVTSSISDLEIGAARYGLLCNEDGGVRDDVIVYRTGQDEALVVVNAGNRDADFAWIAEHADGAGNTVVDRSDELEMIAVQGPNAVRLIDLVANIDVAATERFTMSEIALFGTTALLGRTGYTGEDGVELYVKGGVVDVWQGLLELGAEHGIETNAIGLSARDSLRFEPGYPLYGHELGLDINPFEARLGWAVDLAGVDFIGKEALAGIKAAGITRRLETIVMKDRGVPREGCTVLSQDGDPLGEVVAGMLAPTADVFAANVFLPREYGTVGTAVAVDIRGKHKAAEVTKRPLYRLES